MNTASQSSPNLVTIAKVTEILQRSRASIYRDIKNNAFPKPLKIGGSSRWRLSEIEEMIERLSEQRR